MKIPMRRRPSLRRPYCRIFIEPFIQYNVEGRAVEAQNTLQCNLDWMVEGNLEASHWSTCLSLVRAECETYYEKISQTLSILSR